MAILSVRLRIWMLAVALAAGVPVLAAPPHAEKSTLLHAQPCTEDIAIDAKSSDGELRASRLTYVDAIITQCDVRIQADLAVYTREKSNNSTFEFSGDVHLKFATGSLAADRATVRVSDNRIAQALVTGAPAQFEQQLENLPRPIRGHATSIDFDILAQTVRLSGNAYFNDGRNEMSYPSVLYNIKDQVWRNESAPGGNDRVHMTIRPESAAEPVAPQPQSGRQ